MARTHRTHRFREEYCDTCSWTGTVRLYTAVGTRYWICPSCLTTAFTASVVAPAA
jgi:hypothetical protein